MELVYAVFRYQRMKISTNICDDGLVGWEGEDKQDELDLGWKNVGRFCLWEKANKKRFLSIFYSPLNRSLSHTNHTWQLSGGVNNWCHVPERANLRRRPI